MLYSDFVKATKAPETEETYEQYELINRMYMDCESMTKIEAYRIWKNTYGREIKRRELRQRERLEMLINREEYEALEIQKRAVINNELYTLFWSAYHNKDGSRNRFAIEGRCFIDTYGIIWVLRSDGYYPNYTRRYALYAVIRGQLVDAHYCN